MATVENSSAITRQTEGSDASSEGHENSPGQAYKRVQDGCHTPVFTSFTQQNPSRAHVPPPVSGAQVGKEYLLS